MIKKSLLLFLLIHYIFFICGCEIKNTWYEIPPEFRKNNAYRAEVGKYVGHVDGKHTNVVCEIKGLPSSDYLLLSESDLWTTSIYLLIHKNAQQPLFRYSDKINKIEIGRGMLEQGSKPLAATKDKKIIAELMSLCENETGEKWDMEAEFEGREISSRFYFDLRCKLTWDCKFYFSEDQKIYWVCPDIETGQAVFYDVTGILSPLLD